MTNRIDIPQGNTLNRIILLVVHPTLSLTPFSVNGIKRAALTQLKKTNSQAREDLGNSLENVFKYLFITGSHVKLIPSSASGSREFLEGLLFSNPVLLLDDT